MAAAMWPKTCQNCGRPIRKKSWEKLEVKGIMNGSPRVRDSEKIELRNCSCGSTLAMPESAIKRSDPPKK